MSSFRFIERARVPGFHRFTFTTGAKRVVLWIHQLAGFMHGTDLARESVHRKVTKSRATAGERRTGMCSRESFCSEWAGKVPACQPLVVLSLSVSPEILGALV